MDPLSIIASSIAIFDGLKEAWRFAEDVLKADDERSEFLQRLQCLVTVKESLNECLEVEKLHPGQPWVKRLDPKSENSPLAGLEETVEKMVEILNIKKRTFFKQKVKNFKWHSEKKELEDCFKSLDGYCSRVQAILATANILLSRDTNTSMKLFMTEFQLEKEENRRAKETAERKEIVCTDSALEMLLSEESKELKHIKRAFCALGFLERWLSPLDFQATQRHHFENAARTGKWFIDSKEFNLWTKAKFDVFRAYGESGAANHLMEEMKSSPVLCLFLEKKPSTPHTVKNLLGSLLKQMIQFKESGIDPAIVEIHKRATRFDVPPAEFEIRALLKKEMAACDESIYIIVDALDETSDEIRIFVETQLRDLAPQKVRLLTTTRPDEVRSNLQIFCNICKQTCSFSYHCINCPQDIKHRIYKFEYCKGAVGSFTEDSSHTLRPQDSVDITIITPTEDLDLYVRATIKNQMPPVDMDPSLASRVGSVLGYECQKNPALFEEIISAIVTNVEGRFLLAKQYTKSLGNKMSIKKIKKAVREMKDGQYNLSEMIDKMYEEDLKLRILGQDPEKKETALQIISIVARAHRNLTLKELQHALATEEGETEYDPEGELSRQTILSLTKGLVRIDRDKTATVRLDHRTLEEYLDKTWKQWFDRAEIDLANTCLWYLSFDIFSQPCENIEEFPAKQISHPFISYALQYWGDHVLLAGPEVDAAAVEYLKDQSRVEAYIQAAWAADIHEHDRWDVRRTIHPLHICAWFDLCTTISSLNYKDPEVLDTREGTYGQTPLMYACRRGKEVTARHLLSFGADVNKISGRGRTALTEAVLRGNTEIVKLLLDPQFRGLELNVNSKNSLNRNRTALMEALECGYEEIAIAILNHQRLSINFQDKEGVTALIIAASQGQIKAVKAMLDISGIDLNIQEQSMQRTALIVAAEADHWEVVDLLLRHHADPSLTDLTGGTAMLRAVEEGSYQAFKIMLKFQVSLSCKDLDGKGLIHWAAENGHEEILAVLVRRKVPVNEPDSINMTPLHCAAKSGEVETASILLEHGADIAKKDMQGRCPLVIAWQYGNSEVMDLCKQKGASDHSVQLTMSEDELPLWSLVALNQAHRIPEAIAADPTQLSLKEPGTGNTCLHCAIIDDSGSEEGKELSVQILRELLSASNHHIDEKDNCERTPLHLTAVYRNTQAAKLLLEHDPNLDEVDIFGLTPLDISYTNELYDLAIILIEAGATIDKSKVGLQILLFEAIQCQSTAAIENLIRAGADALAQDERGQTAFQLAKRIGSEQMVQMVNSIHSFVWQSAKGEVEVTTVELIEGKEARDIPFTPFQSPKLELELEGRAMFEDLKPEGNAEYFPPAPKGKPNVKERELCYA